MIGKILKNEYETYEAYTADPIEFLRERAKRAGEYVSRKEHRRSIRSFWFSMALLAAIIFIGWVMP